jgi:uridine monophosphate synthetase
MNNFFSRLEHLALEKHSLLCVGLDPHPEDLPAPHAAAARDFCLRLIEATHEYAIAFKPNAAFFEALGPAGWLVLKEVIAAVPDSIPVLLDAKRGDIASTAEAYARSAFDRLGVDAVTLNPYLGADSLSPFTRDPEKGVFLLCKTSNPGAADLQDLPLGVAGMAALYEYVAHLAVAWNEHGNVGLVVGATQLEALRRVRAAAHGLWFLAPGVGAQGADPAEALQSGLREDGLGMLVPVSRAISRSDDLAKAARDLRDTFNRARDPARLVSFGSAALRSGQASHPSTAVDHPSTAPAAPVPLRAGALSAQDKPRTPHFAQNDLEHLAGSLLDLGCVQFGEFTLKSGQQSPIYIDLRRLVADPGVLSQVAEAFAAVLGGLEFDCLAALPYAAMPIGTAVSLLGAWPLVYPRKETKDYGTKAMVEGLFKEGEVAVVIDDLISTGGSKLEGIQKLSAAGLQVRDVVVLIDRQSGGLDFMSEHGYRLHAVFRLPDLLDGWESSGRVPTEQIERARRFLAA